MTKIEKATWTIVAAVGSGLFPAMLVVFLMLQGCATGGPSRLDLDLAYCDGKYTDQAVHAACRNTAFQRETATNQAEALENAAIIEGAQRQMMFNRFMYGF